MRLKRATVAAASSSAVQAALVVAATLVSFDGASAQERRSPDLPPPDRDLPYTPSCPPPPPPPPSSGTFVCGNGVREDMYEPLCPSCIPGECCVCGWAATNESEQCDGSDLEDHTCEALGFVAGSLSCADDCRFDVSACSHVAASLGGEVRSLPGIPPIFARRELGLASDGSVLGIAVGGGPALTFYAVDAATLAPVGSAARLHLAERPENALSEYYSPKGPLTTTGEVEMVAMADGFVAAVRRFGKTSSTAIVRVRPGEGIDAPHATVPSRPLFLVAGHGGALLGYINAGRVELVLLDAKGDIVTKPSRPFSAQEIAVGQLQASAVTTEDGWLVATGSDGRLAGEVSHVARGGTAAKSHRFADRVADVKLARGTRPVIVFAHEEGVFATRLTMDTALPIVRVSLTSKRPARIIDVTADDETLTVLAELEVGVVSRITHERAGPPVIERVIALPALRPVAETVDGGRLHVLFANEPQSAPPMLYRAR